MVTVGFKQTELGVIPEDWEVVRLGACASVGSGGTPNRGNPAFWGGEIPWITTTQINGTEIDESLEKITGSGLANSAAKMYPKGTLLMAMYGQGKTRGKVGVLGIEASINQACAAIQFHSGFEPSFALHYLNASYEKIRELSNSGGQENLSSGIVKSLMMPRPKSEQEQRAIAAALSDVDGLIAGLEALIAKKRDLKTATLQQLLTGKTRLPGFGEGVGMKQTELGEIPEDWEIRTYGGTFRFLPTVSNSRSDLTEEGEFLYFHYGDIHTRLHGGVDVAQTPIPCIAVEKVRVGSRVNDGDLIMADASEDYEGIGKSIEISGLNGREAVAGLHTFLLRDHEKRFENGFRAYVHLMPPVKQAMDRLATGLKVYGLSKASLQTIAFPLPSKSEQAAIVEVLADIQSSIDAAALELRKAKSIKQGMMQELLTGRTRLI